MKKSQSAPSLTCGSLGKRTSIVRNAFSSPSIADVYTQPDSIELVEHIEDIIPAPYYQKLTCMEIYGFPEKILKDTTLSTSEKNELIKNTLTCILTPEEVPEKPEKVTPVSFQNRLNEIAYVEERFQKLLMSIRKNRKQSQGNINMRTTIH